jgi:hypothetical protein
MKTYEDRYRSPYDREARSADRTAETDHGRSAAQQRFETRLAFEQRQPHQILAVEMPQIEREIDQLGRRIPMPLQARESRGAVREHRAQLFVDIGLPAIERADRGGDVRILGRPVEPVACQQRSSAFDDPRMHAEAVELDFVRPVVAGRNPRHQLAQCRLDPLRRRRKVEMTSLVGTRIERFTLRT